VAGYAARLDPPPAFITASPGGAGFAEVADRVLAGR